ncbi:hypothetical protein BgiBS90_026684 [Biomphalaria glabrata]|nr:hypothetical protein BgiBS90_026684 [Biomphalaria glabrata]
MLQNQLSSTCADWLRGVVEELRPSPRRWCTLVRDSQNDFYENGCSADDYTITNNLVCSPVSRRARCGRFNRNRKCGESATGRNSTNRKCGDSAKGRNSTNRKCGDSATGRNFTNRKCGDSAKGRNSTNRKCGDSATGRNSTNRKCGDSATGRNSTNRKCGDSATGRNSTNRKCVDSTAGRNSMTGTSRISSRNQAQGPSEKNKSKGEHTEWSRLQLKDALVQKEIRSTCSRGLQIFNTLREELTAPVRTALIQDETFLHYHPVRCLRR